MSNAVKETGGNDKCVIVVDENLPLGIIANTAAVLGITLGRSRPEIVGEDVTDASRHSHTGVVMLPVPILKSDGEKLRALRRRLYEDEFKDLLVVDFSNVAQSCKTYDEYRGKVAEAPEEGHDYFGVALLGDKKTVNRLTGSMPLLR